MRLQNPNGPLISVKIKQLDKEVESLQRRVSSFAPLEKLLERVQADLEELQKRSAEAAAVLKEAQKHLRDVDTCIEKQQIELKSFQDKLGQPKVSNWYAWSSMAKIRMRDLHATKCVFVAVHVDNLDPDDDDPFDVACKDPKAQPP